MINQVFNKKNWEKVKFGDISKEVRVSEKEPIKNGIEIYVGLEHIESEDLHIRSWGDVADGTTFTRKFTKGQLLFGRRRAYLRKAAVADFDGICSGDILVFEANTERVLPEFFPFIIQNDSFFNFAVDESAGSLSPRVKYKDLAEYEFLLPPLSEQKKLADLLWAGDEVLQRYRELERELFSNLSITTDNYLIYGSQDVSLSQTRKTKCGIVRTDIKVRKLGECLEQKPQYGANSASIPMVDKDSPRYIRITDIDDNGNLLEEDVVTIKDKEYSSYMLEEGDFLFARTGNTVGKSYLYKKSDGIAVFAGYLIRFKLDKEILLPEFLHIFTHSSKFSEFKRKVIKVGAQPNINSKEYQDMYLPVPSIDEQESIIEKVNAIHSNIYRLRQQIHNTNQLNTSLINQIFG